jgi:hypothetical protein
MIYLCGKIDVTESPVFPTVSGGPVPVRRATEDEQAPGQAVASKP